MVTKIRAGRLRHHSLGRKTFAICPKVSLYGVFYDKDNNKCRLISVLEISICIILLFRLFYFELTLVMKASSSSLEVAILFINAQPSVANSWLKEPLVNKELSVVNSAIVDRVVNCL